MTAEEAQAPPSPRPRFSVIIPVYNDDRLAHCLQALAEQQIDPAELEVLVVDNGSRVVPHDPVSRHPFARLLHQPAPGSYAARNVGVQAARGEVFAFTDSDCRPHPSWLAEAASYLDAHPEVAAIGGRVALDRNPSPSAAELYERLYAFPQETYVNRDGFAATANMVVRRQAFEAVGPFNAAMRSGGDREWGQRLSAAGYQMDYNANVVVAHPPRATWRDLSHKHRRVTAGRKVGRPLPESRPSGSKRAYPKGMGKYEAWYVLGLTPGKVGFSHVEGWRVLGISTLLAMIRMYERWRLKFGGEPLR
jgi:glycosyltransferase involved in cell wall biosynthesis